MKKTIAALALMMSFSLVSTAQPVPQEETWTPSSNGAYHKPAVVGGQENGKNLILCAGHKNGGYHPGKIVGQNCNFGWGGKEILTSSYYTLKVRDVSLYAWKPASNGQIPAGAVKGGFENGHPLYICRAAHKGGIHPGKVVGRNCNFGWGGAEILAPSYHVLVRK